MKLRRCLVPACSTEWKKIDDAIALMGDSLFAFAGLWETWSEKARGEALERYTAATTDPSELLEPLDNRMPVILKRDYARSLTPGEPTHQPTDFAYGEECGRNGEM